LKDAKKMREAAKPALTDRSYTWKKEDYQKQQDDRKNATEEMKQQIKDEIVQHWTRAAIDDAAKARRAVLLETMYWM
jgi:trehalose-6-phosphate synthase